MTSFGSGWDAFSVVVRTSQEQHPIIRADMVIQVRQDSWQPVVLIDLVVRSPAKMGAHMDYLGM
jgi:hypothetical protein